MKRAPQVLYQTTAVKCICGLEESEYLWIVRCSRCQTFQHLICYYRKLHTILRIKREHQCNECSHPSAPIAPLVHINQIFSNTPAKDSVKRLLLEQQLKHLYTIVIHESKLDQSVVSLLEGRVNLPLSEFPLDAGVLAVDECVESQLRRMYKRLVDHARHVRIDKQQQQQQQQHIYQQSLMDARGKALRDYYMQVMLLEQQNKKRLLNNLEADLKDSECHPNKILNSTEHLVDSDRLVIDVIFQQTLSHKKWAVMDKLIAAGAQVDSLSKEGYPLQIASAYASLDTVQKLLMAGADVNAPALGWKCRTALQAASEAGSLEIVEELLKSEAHVNAPPASEGMTALQAAARNGYLTIVKRLLLAGAAVNAPASAKGGRTALQAAAEQGYEEVVVFLLDNGADHGGPMAPINGRTAMQGALMGLHFNVVEALLGAGADIDMRNLETGFWQRVLDFGFVYCCGIKLTTIPQYKDHLKDKHSTSFTFWICSPPAHLEGLPCKDCTNRKRYSSPYTAAAHFRKVHSVGKGQPKVPLLSMTERWMKTIEEPNPNLSATRDYPFQNSSVSDFQWENYDHKLGPGANHRTFSSSLKKRACSPTDFISHQYT